MRMFLLWVCGCDALHTALSVPQAREIVRRWSPEYRFEPPQASKTLKTSALHDFVGVCTSLAALERGERGQCVLQHTHLHGLTLFVFKETGGEWGVSAQVPSTGSDSLKARAREHALRWWSRYSAGLRPPRASV